MPISPGFAPPSCSLLRARRPGRPVDGRLPAAMALAVLLTQLHQCFLPLAVSHGVDFQLELDEELAPALRLDEPVLRQLLQQLLSAALGTDAVASLVLKVQVWAQQHMSQILTIELIAHGRGSAPADWQQALSQPAVARKLRAHRQPLALGRQLARQIGASIRLENGEPAGWHLSVQLRAERAEDGILAGLPAGSAAPVVLDRQVLFDLSQGDWQQEKQLLLGFLRDKQVDLQLLLSAWQQGDLLQIGQLAHRIKGASRSVGAAMLAQLAAQLEQAARAGQLPAVPALLLALEQALQDFSDRVHA